jgi:hypothetical protein
MDRKAGASRKQHELTFDLPDVSCEHPERTTQSDTTDWKATIEKISQMTSKVIPYQPPSCPTKPSDQQAVVLDIVTELCGAIADDQKTLNLKYEQKQKKLKRLKQQCHSLIANIRESKLFLEDQFQAARNDEEISVAQKVTELEVLMATHRANERTLLQTGPTRRHKHAHQSSDHTV